MVLDTHRNSIRQVRVHRCNYWAGTVSLQYSLYGVALVQLSPVCSLLRHPLCATPDRTELGFSPSSGDATTFRSGLALQLVRSRVDRPFLRADRHGDRPGRVTRGSVVPRQDLRLCGPRSPFRRAAHQLCRMGRGWVDFALHLFCLRSPTSWPSISHQPINHTSSPPGCRTLLCRARLYSQRDLFDRGMVPGDQRPSGVSAVNRLDRAPSHRIFARPRPDLVAIKPETLYSERQ